MKINRLMYALLLLMFCMACEKKGEHTDISDFLNGTSQGEFPEEIPLSDLKGTEFALTLENKLSDSLNSIYAPTMLFAWQEIKDFYKSPVDISPSNSLDFKLINQSNSFQHSLNKDEYETNVDTSVEGIIVRAYFKKSLPFAIKFHPQDNQFIFGSTDVKSFGINYPDDSLTDYFEILYYLDNDHFAIKLFPADTSSEIILAMGIDLSGKFSDLLTNTNKWIKTGSKEKTVKAKAWRYTFEEKDYLSIPVIKFHIGTKYSSLEGQAFTTHSKQRSHMIEVAYQRTAFMLDEYGAVVESEAIVACVDSAGAPPVEVSTPKDIMFDKPFVVFIKKKNSDQPYFAMKVMNAELMEKK